MCCTVTARGAGCCLPLPFRTPRAWHPVRMTPNLPTAPAHPPLHSSEDSLHSPPPWHLHCDTPVLVPDPPPAWAGLPCLLPTLPDQLLISPRVLAQTALLLIPQAGISHQVGATSGSMRRPLPLAPGTSCAQAKLCWMLWVCFPGQPAPCSSGS